MSQWGAEGFARHGWDYRRILAHYYPHTTLTNVPNAPVRVLLLDRRPSVALSSKAPFLLVDSRRLRVHVPAGTVRLGSRPRVDGVALRLPVTADAGGSLSQSTDAAYRGR